MERTVPDTSALIGQNIDTAKVPKGYTIRCCSIDGEGQLMTMDLQKNRINVHTVNGIIAGIAGIY
jgi:hypothetical protein